MKNSNSSKLEQLAKFNKLKTHQLIRKEQSDQIKGGDDIIIADKYIL